MTEAGQYYFEPKDPKGGCLIVTLFTFIFWITILYIIS
jgi:hypothetical protein